MDDLESQQSIVSQALGENIKVSHSSPVSGGCIHSASKITLADGRIFFLKQNRASFAKTFQTELDGLAALSETGVVAVPTPVQTGVSGDSTFLLMEWIEPGRSNSQSSSKLGEMLAQLHLFPGEARFGFQSDNFIGSTPQKNTWTQSWPEFFVSNRLKPQLELAHENGFSFQCSVGDSFMKRAESRLPTDCQPSLLHGDLWSGNFLIGPGGIPYLIDPAPYWGHCEADFGILTMFGGFDAGFFEAYRSHIPLEEGFEERLVLYQLYHYLNHLNLFGHSYLGQCQQLLSKI